MKKLIVLAILVFISCNNLNYELDENGNIIPSDRFQPTEDNVKEYKLNFTGTFDTVQDIIYFVHNYITYKYDSKGLDFWQDPNLTLKLKTGDCEDFCILAMFILKLKLNIDSTLISVYTYNSRKRHMLILLKNGLWFDVVAGYETFLPITKFFPHIYKTYSFVEVSFMFYNRPIYDN